MSHECFCGCHPCRCHRMVRFFGLPGISILIDRDDPPERILVAIQCLRNWCDQVEPMFAEQTQASRKQKMLNDYAHGWGI